MFDFSSLDFSGLDLELDLLGDSEKEFIKAAKVNHKPAAFDNAEKMADEIDLSQSYFFFVSGSFIFGDFIEALIYKKRLKPKAVYITTLGMSAANVDSLVNLVDYLDCERLHLIVSNYFVGLERNKLIPYMIQEFAGKPIDVSVLASHCKICLIEANDGRKIIIAGSANLSSSANVEQFQLFQDEAVFDFVRKRLDSIITDFKVIDGEKKQTIFKNSKSNTGKNAFNHVKGDGE